MVNKVTRKALTVSINELRNLVDKLSKEGKELEQRLGVKGRELFERKWLISIINKTPKCSDTWEIEKRKI